ncbi:MAG TPA: hypothetical protein VMI94_16500 [Bryobacteraceae bacterium]|nr:hypothetical protein [Bryobacteraceae bacterium]
MHRIFLAGLLSMSAALAGGNNYKNFDVALYSRVYETRQMKDPAWLESRWEAISRNLKVDKIYLETHRDTVVVDQETLDAAKKFFLSKGVKVSGGITATINERNLFETYCYSDPAQRQKLKEVVEFTARNFDEIILDDFFFTDCKNDGEIQAKGNQSWTAYRLALMDRAGRELVVNPAKAVNPRVHIIIKYPNWYDHFQYMGFNLETEPKYFDKIYTGTETRDPMFGQHLQQYNGYSIFRYFENIKPGGNAGGWVDQGGMRIPGRYAEELWITLFAKAPEITLFNIGSLYQPSTPTESQAAHIAGETFAKADTFLGQLGRPLGVKTYKPYHSSGEDFLPSYLGMAGIPMDIVPDFPADAQTILLTEQAKFDPGIVGKIKKRLAAGATVAITSGLLKALQGKGIEDIVELDNTGQTVATREFQGFRLGGNNKAESDILIPLIRYATNDAWEVVSGLTSPTKTSGAPVLLFARYSKGLLYVLTIPTAMGDLYSYPQGVWRAIRDVLTRDMYVHLDAPPRVSLFVYDNDRFIVESFQDSPVEAHILTEKRITRLRDVVTGVELTGQPQGSNTVFTTPLERASYRVFAAQ